MDVSKETVRIEDFIRERLVSSGCDGYVLGLSGGLDSALVLALAVRAVGVDKVRTYAMPYTRDGNSLEMAGMLAEEFGEKHEVIQIHSIVSTIATTTFEDGENDALRLGNIMARVRMIVLYDMAAANHSLVLNTSNLSELALGYATKYGDNAGDIAPIIHLTKTQIREMSKFVGVPQEIIDQQPSAGLVDGQTDEGDFGFTYEDIDKVLASFMKQGLAFNPSILSRWMKFENPKKYGISQEVWEMIQQRNTNNVHKMLPIASLPWTVA